LLGVFGAVLALVLGAVDVPTPTTSSVQAGVSVPQRDSVYPAHGDPGVDTLHYGLRLRWSRATRTLDGTATIRLRALRDGMVRLDLDHHLRVRSVTFRGHRATSTHPGDKLVVRSGALRSGSTYVLVVRYAGTPGPLPSASGRRDMDGLGMHVTPGGQLWTMQEPYGASTWYPVNDQPADKATYDMRVDVPRPFVGVANGRLVSRRQVGRRVVTTYHSTDPMASYLTTLAVGPYRRVTERAPSGVPLTYWVPRDRPRYLRALRPTPETMAWLERLLGPYPFDRAGVVVTPGTSAMETQTMITLGRGNFRYGGKYVREVVAHELAHAWYGDTVTPDDWSDVWMNEGMAMYLEARYTAEHGLRTWQLWRTTFDVEDSMLRKQYGPPGSYKPTQFAQPNVYFCPARMWMALRTKLGGERFDALIRRWPQQHRNSSQDRYTLTSWWGRQAGVGWSWFEPWLLGRKSPAAARG
jgi:aminopeptidase N